MDDVSYWYEGRSPQTGEWLRLPRTQAVETHARELMQELANDERYCREGKMYGVLLVTDAAGKQHVLKAFSGLLNGESVVEGWVPPIPGRATVAFEEAMTLSQLDAIKQEMIALQNLPERSHLATLTQQFATELNQLAIDHQLRKQLRQQQREIFQATLTDEKLEQALEGLNIQSQQDGIQRRKLKSQQTKQLKPLKQMVEAAEAQIRTLKQQRKHLSKQLQIKLYEAYHLTNFAGISASLEQLMPNGVMPTGTGECCAPKLLHYAAAHELRPLAMAEFWWGTLSTQDDKIPGEFYGACRDRCQPLMGFLLSGLEGRRSQETEVVGAGLTAGFVDQSVRLQNPPTQKIGAKGVDDVGAFGQTPILYEDEWIIVVDKPAGLLSVPGRYHDRQDSVVSRLRSSHPDLKPVHRLDQDTSGILVLAQDSQTDRLLSQQFQARQVHKVYEALLVGAIPLAEGIIELPLWGNPNDRPRQTVDWERGKPSSTKFRVIRQDNYWTRIEFFPLTGRTHQLRVHAADPQGLGAPIWGDRLYGCASETRLHLHAKELIIQHPHTGRSLDLASSVPF